MEENFIFNSIKKFREDEIFHKISVYVLKWQPPGSNYIVNVPLDDPQLQENMLIVLENMKGSERRKVVFFFSTKNPLINLFAPKVHPASLVSYRTKEELMKKLCDLYLEGLISLVDLKTTLASPYHVWESAVYNMLPEDEQEFHEYLVTRSAETLSKKALEKQYLDDDITLERYNELKFPDRKKRKDIESMQYPLPYNRTKCIVCEEEDAGIIPCQNCINQVCIPCVHRFACV